MVGSLACGIQSQHQGQAEALDGDILKLELLNLISVLLFLYVFIKKPASHMPPAQRSTVF